MNSSTGRTIDTCPHRAQLSQEFDLATHRCTLAQSICGAEDEGLFAVRLDECAVCCRMNEPRADAPNGLVASTLYKALRRIMVAGGVEGCDAVRAESLIPFAKRHFSVVCFESTAGADLLPAGRVSYTGPCRHLGLQTGERLCKSCRGQVRQKVFACHHPEHSTTTIRDCQACAEYQPGMVPPAIGTE